MRFRFMLFVLFVLQMHYSAKADINTISKNLNTYEDTVYIYDTVWVYEAVYDTIWVYDTIYMATALKQLNKMKPIEVKQIYYSPFQYRILSLSEITNFKKQKPIKRNKLHKLRYDLKQKKKEPKRKKHSVNYDPKLTLNPNKGKFDLHVLSRGVYSLEAYSGPVFHNTQYSNIANAESITRLNNSIMPLTGIEYGLLVNYNVFQYTVQTGVGLSQLRNEFYYTQININVDSTEYSKTISHIVTRTDTLNFLDIDALLNGDTTWVTYYDTYDTLIIEDSLYYTYDTSRTEQQETEINTHAFLEIPIIFSYEWAFSKIAFQLKLGGVNQIHLLSKGKSYSNTGNIEDINEVMNFTKYNFALYGGIGVVYNLKRQFGFGLNIYYKYPLRKYSTSYSEIINKQSYGINISLRYRLKTH